MNLRQNSGKANSENIRNCGRHGTTSAMQSEPARYHRPAFSSERPRIQKYSPHTVKASAMEMGSE